MGLKRRVKKATRIATLLAHPRSISSVLRLRQSGRTGGSHHPKDALPLDLRGLNFPLYCRPGTSDYVTFREIFVSDGGEYTAFLEDVREPVDYILDLGTNVGYAIAFFLREWPNARVTGIEPYGPNVRMAKKSLAPLIERGQVKIHHGFAGAEAGRAALTAGGAGGVNELRKSADASSNSEEMSESAPVLPVAKVLAEDRPNGKVDILKCDVEGGETDIFMNCSSWIKRVRHLVVELHEGRDVEWIQSRLRENGGCFELQGTQKGHGNAILTWFRSNEK
jgi:FkbM family methyltransferase